MGYNTSKTIAHSAVSDSDVYDETSIDDVVDGMSEDGSDGTNKTKSNDGNEISYDESNDSSDSDVDGNGLIDNEALEVTDETESESCDDDDRLQLLAYEGGSCIPKQKVKPLSTIEHSKMKGYKFTPYSENSDTESDDSFVVSDDYVEYDSAADNLTTIEENIGKCNKKYKRVILSESSSTAEDSASEIADTDFTKAKQGVEQHCIQTVTLSPKVASKPQTDKLNNENDTISENKNCSKINNKKFEKRILIDSNFVVTTINDKKEYPGEQQSHLLMVKQNNSNFVATTINDSKEYPRKQQSHLLMVKQNNSNFVVTTINDRKEYPRKQQSHLLMVKKNNSNFVVTTSKDVKKYPSEQQLHPIVLKKTSGKRKHQRISGEENMRKKQKTV